MRPRFDSTPLPAPASVRRARTALALACALIALSAVAPSGASAYNLLLPSKGKAYFGTSDTGHDDDFRAFADAVGKHPPVVQSFVPWGDKLGTYLSNWHEFAARPIIHIHTRAPGSTYLEAITPRGIATAGDDDFLLRLNAVLAGNNIRAYVRPLGEPNRCLNIFAAFDCYGNSRGSAYETKWYRLALRRIYIIVHGGGSLGQINRRLGNAGLRDLDRQAGGEPKHVPAAPVAVIWSPLPGGSPATQANNPKNYYPGDRYTDWVATDFYSKYLVWKTLKHFYQTWAVGHHKPFALTEWGVNNGDDPKFVHQLFAFMDKRKRYARMLAYYQDYGSNNSYRIQNYPSAQQALADELSSNRFPGLAPFPPPAPPPPPPPAEPDSGGVAAPGTKKHMHKRTTRAPAKALHPSVG